MFAECLQCLQAQQMRIMKQLNLIEQQWIEENF